MSDKAVISFKNAQAWRKWLEENHDASPGIEMRLFKKNSGHKSVTYDEALDEALCFGWIDGIVHSYDEASYLQKFCPRRPKGTWSKRNREHIERLVREKRMTEAGMKEVEAAKADGRWDLAYDSPKNATVPDDLLKELKKDNVAYAFFKTLNKANTYAIVWRLQTAKKPATRKKRKQLILEMLTKGKKFH